MLVAICPKQGTFEYEPEGVWLPQYDPTTHFRTSPDIKRFRTPDGVWYHANGLRDEARSSKQDLSDLIYKLIQHYTTLFKP